MRQLRQASHRAYLKNANEGIDTVQTSLDGYVLPTNMENLTLTGSANLSGNGNGLDKCTDEQYRRKHAHGRLGNDTYVLNNAGDIVIENPGEGTDTVVAGFSYSLATSNNVENLTLTGSAGLSATGNAADNVLTSNTGVNTLTGGLGNDIYVLSNAADSVVENPGEGTDTVQFAGNFNGTSFLLPTTIENATNVGSVSLTLTEILSATHSLAAPAPRSLTVRWAMTRSMAMTGSTSRLQRQQGQLHDHAEPRHLCGKRSRRQRYGERC
jgi:hypothetical protein